MSVHPNQAWLDRSNAQTLYHLERQGRTGPGLVPFLGAGLSTAYKLKNWRDLLLSAASPRLSPVIEEKLNSGDYEGARRRDPFDPAALLAPEAPPAFLSAPAYRSTIRRI